MRYYVFGFASRYRYRRTIGHDRVNSIRHCLSLRYLKQYD